MTDFDAIVVGSGAGGLSSALRMAQQDISVLVLEAMPAFGGYINPFVRDGFCFDTGLHYLGKLGPGGSFREILRLLALDESVDFVEIDPDGFDRYLFPDFELRLCKGTKRFQSRLHRLFPGESTAIRRYFELLDRLLKAFSDPQGPPKSLFSRLQYIFRHSVLMRYHRATYQKMLDDITDNRNLQAALSAHCGNSGLPPERASAFLCMMLLDHYLEGAFYPKGGSAALRDAFVTALKRYGTVLKSRMPVTGIHRSHGTFVVTCGEKGVFTAKSVVSNVDPLIAFRELIDPRLIPRGTRKKVARMRPSGGSFYAFVGTQIDLAGIGMTDANLIHFDYTDVNRTFGAIATRKTEEPFPYYFITSPSLKDPESHHAPEGCHTLQIISSLGETHPFGQWSGTSSRKRGEDYLRLKNRIGMSLVRSAERYIPGLGDHLTYVEFATPLTNAYWVNSYQGGNFGPAQTPDQFGPCRFLDCKSGIDGLFVVGAGAISAGVLSCMASGVWAANQVADFLGANTTPS